MHYITKDTKSTWWCNSRVSNVWSIGCEFNSRSGHYRVVITRKGDRQQRNKPSKYLTNAKVNSAFHPSGVGKASTSLSGWG